MSEEEFEDFDFDDELDAGFDAEGDLAATPPPAKGRTGRKLDKLLLYTLIILLIVGGGGYGYLTFMGGGANKTAASNVTANSAQMARTGPAGAANMPAASAVAQTEALTAPVFDGPMPPQPQMEQAGAADMAQPLATPTPVPTAPAADDLGFTDEMAALENATAEATAEIDPFAFPEEDDIFADIDPSKPATDSMAMAAPEELPGLDEDFSLATNTMDTAAALSPEPEMDLMAAPSPTPDLSTPELPAADMMAAESAMASAPMPELSAPAEMIAPTPTPEVVAPAPSLTPAPAAEIVADVEPPPMPTSAAEMALIENADMLQDMRPPIEAQEQEETLNMLSAEEVINSQSQIPVEDINMDAVIRPLPQKYLIVQKDSSRRDRKAQLAAAERSLSNQEYQVALEIFGELYEENPNDPKVLMGRAVTFQKLGDHESALQAYEETLQSDPKNLAALTNMLGILRLESPEFVVDKLADLRRSYPANAGISAQLGVAYGNVGNFDKALQYIQIATNLEPQNANYVYNKAVLFDQMGKTAEAVEHYRQALQMQYRANTNGLSRGKKQLVPVEAIRQRLLAIQ